MLRGDANGRCFQDLEIGENTFAQQNYDVDLLGRVVTNRVLTNAIESRFNDDTGDRDFCFVF